MFLSSKDLKTFYDRTQYYSTEKLLKLEFYLRNNCNQPIYNQMYRIIEMTLIKRVEGELKNKRNNHIDYLNKCLSISTPMGRLSASIIKYVFQILKNKKLWKTII